MTDEEMIENLKCVIADTSEQCEQLKSENAALRADLLETISFALSLCNDEMCEGDLSCGIIPCEMFKDFTKKGDCEDWECKLKRIRRKLEERND